MTLYRYALWVSQLSCILVRGGGYVHGHKSPRRIYHEDIRLGKHLSDSPENPKVCSPTKLYTYHSCIHAS